MFNSRGIFPEHVTKNGRFSFSVFKERIIDTIKIGETINPKTLMRLAAHLGAKGDTDELRKKLTFEFNSGNPRLKRRRGESGYIYEKTKA